MPAVELGCAGFAADTSRSAAMTSAQVVGVLPHLIEFLLVPFLR